MYNYQTERSKIFTEEGQRDFLKVRDHVCYLLKTAGAVSMGKAMTAVSGNSWQSMAYVDRLVELGELIEVTNKDHVWAQNRVFIGRKL